MYHLQRQGSSTGSQPALAELKAASSTSPLTVPSRQPSPISSRSAAGAEASTGLGTQSQQGNELTKAHGSRNAVNAVKCNGGAGGTQ